MQVGLFIPKLVVGGAGMVMLHLESGLHQRGHATRLYYIGCTDAMRLRLKQRGSVSSRIPKYARTIAGVPYLTRLLRRHQLQLLHTHCIASVWLMMALACRAARIPNVHTAHQPFRPAPGIRGRRQRLRVRLAARLCSALVGVSQEIVESLKPYCDPAKLHYIPNGVADMFLTEPPLQASPRVVGTVTRLDTDKDPLTFLEAAVQAHATLPDLQFLVVGGGALHQPLQRWIEERNATDYIQLLGMRSDIPELLAQMSVFVLSSRSEGMPLAVLEAMSAQRPIIATAVGEVPTVLEGGACGIIVPPGDPQRLAQEIVQLIQEPERAAQLAARARQKYLKCYTLETTVSRYLQLYQSVYRKQRFKNSSSD